MTRIPQSQLAALPASERQSPLKQGLLQRKCSCGGSAGSSGKCEECEREKNAPMHRKAVGQPGLTTAPPVVHQTIQSPGKSLDRSTGALMQSALGHNFGSVRIHTDAKAAESARAVSALAYTVGESVVFAANQYAPQTAAGRQLLAHELTHVVQQRSGSAAHSSEQQLEAEADRCASQLDRTHKDERR